MKNSLGSLVLLSLIFLHVELFASTYEWSVSANKKEAYVGEAIHLKYRCSFSDRGELYSIDFKPVGEYDKYTIKLLTEETKLVNGQKVNSYEFVAFAKKAGKIEFAFDAIMKKTNDDSIKNTVLGRDNAFYEEFTATKIKQKTIHIDVIKPSNSLVGDLRVEVKKDKLDIKAYQPYHMQIIFKGNADYEAIKPIEFKIEGVKVFTGKMIKNVELTSSGFEGTWSQKFAFVGTNSFEIPKIEIEYFNLKSKSKETLLVDASIVEVAKGYAKAELLDEVEDGFKINYEYLYYLLFFVTGFLAGKIKFKKEKELDAKSEEFIDKVNGTQSINQLVVILAMQDKKKFEDIISDIESKQVTSLSKAKKEIVDLI